jgi:hydrogenase expression/formation protein HypE
VSEIDQFLPAGKLPGNLLDRLIETYRTRPDPAVIVTTGYGRDAAAIDPGSTGPLIVKSDPITFATGQAASYLLAVNGNDIACLGGVPRWISVVLLLPEGGTTESSVESLFADLQSAADAAEVAVIGGHTEVTSAVTRPIFIGTMLGLAGPGGILKPGGGAPGDDLYLTQSAGLEGTALLARELEATLLTALDPDLVRRAAHLLHDPGISVSASARAVLETGMVTALHDPTEGGVATAIHEMAIASGAGATIETSDITIRHETSAICNFLGIDPLGLISSGALLVAGRPKGRDDILRAVSGAGVPISRIGSLVPPEQGITTASGRPLPRFDTDEITRVL